MPYETATASLESAELTPLVHPRLSEYPPADAIPDLRTDNPSNPPPERRRAKSGETYTEWRRHVYWEAYQRANCAYDFLDQGDEGTRRHRLDECGSFAWFVHDTESGQVFIESNSCGLRWCPMCAAKVRKTTAANAADWIKHIPDPKFLTLTLKHTDAPLGQQVTQLYRSFALLRKRKQLKGLFRGGIWFFQIKFNTEHQQFHPHLHILLDGKRRERTLISKLWLDVTGDSCVIDIRKIWDIDKAAAEVARYAATPCSLTKLDIGWAYTVVQELEGRKLCGTFGSARNVHLRQQIEHPKETRERIADFRTMVELASENREAQTILNALYNRKPVSTEIIREFRMKFDADFQLAVKGLTVRPPPPPLLFS